MYVLPVSLLVVLLCCRSVSSCTADLIYRMADSSPEVAMSGYMEASPPMGSVTFDGVANFDGTGMLKLYKFAAVDWRPTRSLAFEFLPTDPTLTTQVSLMTNNATDDAGTLMVTWTAGEVTFKVMFELWNSTTLQFDRRTVTETITNLDLTQTQFVRISFELPMIKVQCGPQNGGGYPTAVSIPLKHDEHVMIAGWDPLIFGKGTSVAYIGTLDNFEHFPCVPTSFFL